MYTYIYVFLTHTITTNRAFAPHSRTQAADFFIITTPTAHLLFPLPNNHHSCRPPPFHLPSLVKLLQRAITMRCDSQSGEGQAKPHEGDDSVTGGVELDDSDATDREVLPVVRGESFSSHRRTALVKLAILSLTSSAEPKLADLIKAKSAGEDTAGAQNAGATKETGGGMATFDVQTAVEVKAGARVMDEAKAEDGDSVRARKELLAVDGISNESGGVGQKPRGLVASSGSLGSTEELVPMNTSICSAREGLHWLSRPLQIRLRIRCTFPTPDIDGGGGSGSDGGGGGGGSGRPRNLSDTVVVLVEPMAHMSTLEGQ